MSHKIVHATYKFPAATLSGAAIVGRIPSPIGAIGEVTSVAVLCTTNLTGSEGTLTIGRSGNSNAYGTLTLPNTSADSQVDGAFTKPYQFGVIPRAGGEVIEVAAGGEPTAGAGDIYVTVKWTL